MHIRTSALAMAFLSLSAVAQSLTLGTTPNSRTPMNGVVYVLVGTNSPTTLTSLDFWTGFGTPGAPNVTVDVYLAGGPYELQMLSDTWQHVASTVPTTTTNGPVMVSSPLVPVAPFTTLTLPVGWFSLALVAHNTELGTTLNQVHNQNAQLTASSDRTSLTFRLGGPTAVAGFTGTFHYTVGGTPMTLSQISSYGSGCGNLQLSVASPPTIGGAAVFTTSGPTNFGVGACFITMEDISGPLYPNGIDLASYGAPGCAVHVWLTFSAAAFIDNMGIGSMSAICPIPNGTWVAGSQLFAQSVWCDPSANAAGWITSNGMRAMVL